MSYSPYTILYNACINVLIKKREELFTKEEEKGVWLPDILSIYLILDAKDNNIDFSKFPFIQNESFDELVSFFKDTPQLLAKRR